MGYAVEQTGKYAVVLIAGTIYLYILFVLVNDLSYTSPIYAAITGTALISAVAWALIIFAQRGE
jgi:hypothetical protein